MVGLVKRDCGCLRYLDSCEVVAMLESGALSLLYIHYSYHMFAMTNVPVARILRASPTSMSCPLQTTCKDRHLTLCALRIPTPLGTISYTGELGLELAPALLTPPTSYLWGIHLDFATATAAAS